MSAFRFVAQQAGSIRGNVTSTWQVGLRNESQQVLDRPVQRRIVADVEAGRARIASEREKARVLSRQIETDVEAYLLGTKKVGTN